MVRKYISVWYIELIFVLPALFLGILVMQKLRLPSTIYLQNIIAVFFCWLLSCIFLAFSPRTKKNIEYLIVLLILVGFILTLLNEGVDGVHRWIALGPLDFHVSSILSPLLIILLWKQLEENNNILTFVVIVSISLIILLQPDASQITAISGPLIIILYRRGKNKYLSYFIILILSIMCIASWIYLDSLPPVIYV